ncbi:hypothetical protein [Agriterribacter sp.]|uniref:hypothetical protein n=1 Tax=Agriterribacter sp. TaxID=2821509 RepID=UPI002C9D4CAB|nr:hypothetical protein [Agriterribacter sp.]HRP58257.1 hypothetical protein [Agriterribacter sp.]
MEHVKNELQHIILGNESPGSKSKLKKAQAFLRRNAEAGFYDQEQQYLKSEEAAQLITFAQTEDLIYQPKINEAFFISAGAEQRVYRYDDYKAILFKRICYDFIEWNVGVKVTYPVGLYLTVQYL